MSFDNRVCLVTGAGRGIGRGVALAYGARKAKVALLARTESELNETAAQVNDHGGEALVVVADVSDSEQTERAVTQVLQQWGRIDVLMHAAGIIGPGGLIHDTDPAEWQQTLVTNVVGGYHILRAVAPAMIARKYGRVVNIVSTAAVQPLERFSAYCASKAALVHFTRVAANELRPHGITVNAAGVWARTRMWQDQANQPGGGDFSKHLHAALAAEDGPTVKENLPLLLFLSSDASAHVTGSFIEANSLSHVHLRLGSAATGNQP